LGTAVDVCPAAARLAATCSMTRLVRPKAPIDNVRVPNHTGPEFLGAIVSPGEPLLEEQTTVQNATSTGIASDHTGRRYQVRLTLVTSMVLMTQKQSRIYTGTYEELQETAKQAFLHTVLLGWWGIPFGPIWTIMALRRNHKAMLQLESPTQSVPQSLAA
jgi:hypothetical protein